MKAVLCSRPGTPDDLTLADLPDPVAGPGEAVVRIAAAALNFFDLLIIAGKYQFKPAYPFSPGAEFAGTVESVGPDVTEVAVGDRVMGYSGWGAAREKLAIKVSKLSKIPAVLDVDRAAGLSVTYGTSYYGLKNRGALKRGETLACSAPPAASASPRSSSASSWVRASSPAHRPTTSSRSPGNTAPTRA